uniref:PDGF_2 domain-containing protein n=1 Tax=Syphacia muris TaxID=451379 RepID=A0A0N5APE9_9BILA
LSICSYVKLYSVLYLPIRRISKGHIFFSYNVYPLIVVILTDFNSKICNSVVSGKASNTHTNDVNLLKTVKQGADTCYLQTVCQPVPLDDDADPQILLFPRCSEVTRCIGSCCDTGKSCKPTRKEYVFKTVFRLKYIGNSKFAIDKKLSIPMEQHLGCQCRQCQQWEFIRCGKNQVVGPNCDCICRNEIEKASCQGLRQWSEETCSCKCRPMSCSEGAVFNDRNCTCIYQKEVRCQQYKY